MGSEYETRAAELDAAAAEMGAEGRLTDRLRCMEDALSFRAKASGSDQPDVQKEAEKLIREYNTVAMQLLNAGIIALRACVVCASSCVKLARTLTGLLTLYSMRLSVG